MLRYYVQFFTILLFYSIGNGMVSWLQLPIPGSIAGLFLLFIALNFRVCQLKWVEAIAQLHIGGSKACCRSGNKQFGCPACNCSNCRNHRNKNKKEETRWKNGLKVCSYVLGSRY